MSNPGGPQTCNLFAQQTDGSHVIENQSVPYAGLAAGHTPATGTPMASTTAVTI